MRLALIAGNRALPLHFSKLATKNNNDLEIVAICFKKEANPHIKKLVDKTYWIDVGELGRLIDILKKENIKNCVMLGQISPRRIFERRNWDRLMIELVKDVDWRSHSIFSRIVSYLEKQGLTFLESTLYMSQYLAEEGVMNRVPLDKETREDVEFGFELILRYVELDVGQTMVVKNKAVVAFEALEGTDQTIKRAYNLAGIKCVVLKFSKKDQDLRFDVPIVGISTLSLLKKVKARALVVEAGRVIILDKEKFLDAAQKWDIAIIGKKRVSQLKV